MTSFVSATGLEAEEKWGRTFGKNNCRRAIKELGAHVLQSESVPLIAWAGLKNSALLAKAEKRFDVLLTMDSSMTHPALRNSQGAFVVAPQINPATRSKQRAARP
jgi:hypothetical protein